MQTINLNSQASPLLAANSNSTALLAVSRITLSQLHDAITVLTTEQYSQSPLTETSAIGKHVRHIVEFYQALFSYLQTPSSVNLCYDKRVRNPELESSAQYALAEIRKIRESLTATLIQDCEITVASVVVPGAPLVTMNTTLLRELFYLLDHTIHHMAIVKLIAQCQGVILDSQFGLAQSTKQYQQVLGG